MGAAGIGLFTLPKVSKVRPESLFSTQLMGGLEGQACESLSQGAEVKRVNVEDDMRALGLQGGHRWGWAGALHMGASWHTQQMALFLLVWWDMFQEGAEVPGEDAEAVGGEG